MLQFTNDFMSIPKGLVNFSSSMTQYFKNVKKPKKYYF